MITIAEIAALNLDAIVEKSMILGIVIQHLQSNKIECQLDINMFGNIQGILIDGDQTFLTVRADLRELVIEKNKADEILCFELSIPEILDLITDELQPKMKQYRVTRRKLYPKGTLGHSDLSARQGYYIKANSQESALSQMLERFPNEYFDFEIWQDYHG